MSIGDNIKKVRKKRNVTQEKLATDIGLSRSYIGDLENNRYNPSTKTLEMLAQKLNVSTLYLSTGDDNYIDLSYDEGIADYFDEMVKKQAKSYKENRKHADDFNVKEIDEVVERFREAVYYQKDVIRNDEKMNFHNAAYLKDLYLSLGETDPADFSEDELNKLREIIVLLLSNARDINIDEIHEKVTKSEPKKK